MKFLVNILHVQKLVSNKSICASDNEQGINKLQPNINHGVNYSKVAGVTLIDFRGIFNFLKVSLALQVPVAGCRTYLNRFDLYMFSLNEDLLCWRNYTSNTNQSFPVK